jgi:hypothetical protein
MLSGTWARRWWPWPDTPTFLTSATTSRLRWRGGCLLEACPGCHLEPCKQKQHQLPCDNCMIGAELYHNQPWHECKGLQLHSRCVASINLDASPVIFRYRPRLHCCWACMLQAVQPSWLGAWHRAQRAAYCKGYKHREEGACRPAAERSTHIGQQEAHALTEPLAGSGGEGGGRRDFLAPGGVRKAAGMGNVAVCSLQISLTHELWSTGRPQAGHAAVIMATQWLQLPRLDVYLFQFACMLKT